MVLGFHDFPCSPNNYGLVYEADNYYIMDLERAKELAQKVTEDGRERYDSPDFKAQIVMLTDV